MEISLPNKLLFMFLRLLHSIFHIGSVIKPKLPYQDFFQALTYIAEKVFEQTAKINP
jgi:hypothetical protein